MDMAWYGISIGWHKRTAFLTKRRLDQSPLEPSLTTSAESGVASIRTTLSRSRMPRTVSVGSGRSSMPPRWPKSGPPRTPSG